VNKVKLCLLICCALSLQLLLCVEKKGIEESPYCTFLKSIISGENEVQSYVEMYGVGFLKQKNCFNRNHYSSLIPIDYMKRSSNKTFELTAYDIAIATNNFIAASDIEAYIMA